MRSKAHIKGHPIHPILVAFPITFFTGSLLFDLGGWIGNRPQLWQTGSYLELAGIVFALLAAIPGIIDFVFVVPPESSAKKRGAKHGVTNFIMVAIFAVAAYYRRGSAPSPAIITGLETVGVILLGFAGWLGGTLVYRNQIGVDIRYAEAGKWKEQYLKGAQEFAATVNELKVNQMKLLHINNKRIVLARTEKGFTAFDDRCTHRGASLAAGSLICGTVQCPWHGSQFDVQTGALQSGPAKEKIGVYAVEEKNGKLYVKI